MIADPVVKLVALGEAALTTRNYRRYDEDFKQGAVALVAETGHPIAQVAADAA
jgi:hypothetical protein